MQSQKVLHCHKSFSKFSASLLNMNKLPCTMIASRQPSKRIARGVAAKFSIMALLVLFSLSPVDAFAPRLKQGIRSATSQKISPRADPLAINMAGWDQLDSVETELVNDNEILSRVDYLKSMAIDDEDPNSAPNTINPTPVLFKAFQELSQKSTAAAAVVALAYGLFMTPMPSLAVMSGGRIGGSYSSPSRSSFSSGSVMPRSSYGGSFSRGFGSGYGAGYYSRPSVMINPFPITPFYSPFSPFGFGSPGVVTVSRGPSFFSLLLLGGFALAAANVFSSMSNAASSWGDDSSSSVFSSGAMSALGPGTSFVQVTVALEVPDRDSTNSILGALGRIAKTARTDCRVGIQNLTSQVALELLRRKSSIVSAHTYYKHFNDRSTALREFSNRSIKERSKFESETVSNYGGVDYGNRGSGGEGSSKATMAVVTLLLSIDGDSTKVPQIRSAGDVEEALRQIASDAKVDTCLQSAEILWTPEDRSETLSQRDVIADYPELRSI